MVLIDASKGDRLAGISVGIDVRKSRLERALNQVCVHSAADLFGPDNAVCRVSKMMGEARWLVAVGWSQLKAVAPQAFKDAPQFSYQTCFDRLVFFEFPNAPQEVPVL